MTREGWLNAFINLARAKFAEVGAPLPKAIRVSIGFPSSGCRGNRIGECWSDTASADGHFEIFVHPSLGDCTMRVAEVLTHELVHCAVGLEAKHGKDFRKVAVALGLEGKMTATTGGNAWRDWALPLIEEIGLLQHAPLAGGLSPGRKKQSTRMLKLTCNKCGWSCRAAASHIDDEGLICPRPVCDGDLERV
jgi:hypothetical protein